MQFVLKVIQLRDQKKQKYQTLEYFKFSTDFTRCGTHLNLYREYECALRTIIAEYDPSINRIFFAVILYGFLSSMIY